MQVVQDESGAGGGENASGDAALVLLPLDPKTRETLRAPEARLEEAVGLARAIDLDVRDAEVVPLRRIRPATYLGTGAVERIAEAVEEIDAVLVCVDTELSPVQQRNLEKAWNCKVVDRTGLILEIFGARARTREGRLQVDLAHLTYQRSRLVRSWTHLERQRGGAGFLGGPGETQIEADRRQIAEKISRIRKELETVTRTRTLHREARRRVPYPVIALVGYTNAGKSTLFNRITGSGVMAKDLLFATLDPTMRAIEMPSGRSAILSDTVGFISNLPTHLVAAFRATLEEVVDADILLHVRDVSHPDTEAQRADVTAVLGDLGVDGDENPENERTADLIEVLNKTDLLDDDARASVMAMAGRRNDAVAVSAATGEGVETLLTVLDERLAAGKRTIEVEVPHADGATLAWLYRHAEVLGREDDERVARLTVVMGDAEIGRFRSLQSGQPNAV